MKEKIEKVIEIFLSCLLLAEEVFAIAVCILWDIYAWPRRIITNDQGCAGIVGAALFGMFLYFSVCETKDHFGRKSEKK